MTMLLTAMSLPWILLRLRSWWEIAVIVGLLALWGIFLTCKEKLRKYRTRGGRPRRERWGACRFARSMEE